MDPGEIVTNVVRDLALQGEYGAPLVQLWDFAANSAGQEIDDVLKAAIWRWVALDPRVIVTDSGSPLTRYLVENSSFDALNTKYQLHLYATEDEQWLTLTGRPKQGNALGAFPFKILTAVTRAGPGGLTAIEINKQTGQDARSIFGRVQKLSDMDLVTRFPVVKDGNHTNLVIAQRYLDEKDHNDTTNQNGSVNKQQLDQQMVELTKSGPKGIKLIEELFQQLGFENMRTGSSLMRRMVARLETIGVLKRIDVFEPSNPAVRYRCVQYIKDLPSDQSEQENDGLLADYIDDTPDDYDDDDELNGEKTSINAGGGAGPRVENMVVAGAQTAQTAAANLYYPIEHQIYDFIASKGVQGLTAMELYKTLVGNTYARPLSRFLLVLVHKSDKKNKATISGNLAHLSIIGGFDFVARMKFYRYFTQPSYALYNKKELSDSWGAFSNKKSSIKSSIRELNTNISGPPLGNSSVFQNRNGHLKAIFQGDKKPGDSFTLLRTLGASDSTKKRGRPRKNPKQEDNEEPSPSPVPSLPTGAKLKVSDYSWVGGSPVDSHNVQHLANILREPPTPPAATDVDDKTQVSVPAKSSSSSEPSTVTSVSTTKRASNSNENASESRYQALSLANRKREDAILELLAKSNGVLEGGIALTRLMDEHQQAGTSIDKKTLTRSLKSLLLKGKIKQMFITTPSSRGISITRYLIHDPEIAESDPRIVTMKQNISESVKSKPILSNASAAKSADEIDEGSLSAILQTVPNARRFHVLGEKGGLSARPAKTRFGPSAQDINAGNISTGSSRGRPRISEEQRRHNAEVKAKAKEAREQRKLLRKREREEETEIMPGVPMDAEMLYRAVVVSRSLQGSGANIDWDLVAKVVPGANATKARKKWPSVRESYGGSKALKKANEQWESIFLAAYSAGEIGFTDPSSDDFQLEPYISLWKNRSSGLDVRSVDFTSREDFELRMGPIRSKPLKNSLEQVYNLPSMIKVDELMVNTPFGEFRESLPVAAPTFNAAELSIRTVIGADTELYDNQLSESILSKFQENEVNEAIESLTNLKVATYIPRDNTKVLPGRNYGLTERVTNALATKFDADFISKAKEFHQELAGVQEYELPTTLTDASMATILELVSLDKVVLTGKDVRTGKLISDYRSRMVAKEKLDFKVNLKIENAELPDPAMEVPPLSPDLPYIWQTGDKVTGLDIWNKLVQFLLLLSVTRPHVPVDLAIASLRAAMITELEANAVITWLTEIEAITVEDGLVASPEWYAINNS